MAVTSVELAGVELMDGVDYYCGAPMLAALEATDPREARLLTMAARPPWYVDSVLKERSVPIIVGLLGSTYTARKAAWDTLYAAINPLGLVALIWIQDGVTKSLDVTISEEVVPDVWFQRATGQLIAPDPRAVTV